MTTTAELHAGLLVPLVTGRYAQCGIARVQLTGITGNRR